MSVVCQDLPVHVLTVALSCSRFRNCVLGSHGKPDCGRLWNVMERFLARLIQIVRVHCLILPGSCMKLHHALAEWLCLTFCSQQPCETMGAVSSGLSDGILRANCCVQRRPPVRCFNPHLNLQLLKLEHSGARIEEVWLVKQENERSQGFSPMAEPAETRLAIVYNISESASQPSLKPLRLDWQPDGLAFMWLVCNRPVWCIMGCSMTIHDIRCMWILEWSSLHP